MHSLVADAHVDVLMRMVNESCSFYEESHLQASHSELVRGNVRLQIFALFVSPRLPATLQLESVLLQIDRFYEQVVLPGRLRGVANARDYVQARTSAEISAVLSLEGCGCLRGQPQILRVLSALGVRGCGLTWNASNELADGCGELRDAGLSLAGRQVVEEMARLSMWLDLAHLGDQGVDDALTISSGAVMASHANARAIYDHRRNLPDHVLRELIRRRGWIGITFESAFLAAAPAATLDHLFAHVDHVLTLGGEDCVGFGSDFDGLLTPVETLTSAGCYHALSIAMRRRYGDDLTQKILFDNLDRFLLASLPVA